MKSHKDLDVWKAAVELVEKIYELTGGYPGREQFGMTSQMCRSSVSIPSNIAEGAARQSSKEFIQYLHYALGSAAELETQLEISRRVKLCDAETFQKLDAALTNVRHMLRGLIRSVKV